jgi:putative membrane protein
MSHHIALLLGVFALAAAPLWALAGTDSPPKTTASFLQHAAEGQQSEIDLGELAVQKAGNEQVKQFGSRMIEDHTKARQEVQQLASKSGVQLPSRPGGLHKDIKDQLSKLSGKEFDRAYITAMLREHTKEMKELEQQSLLEKNPEVRQWAAGAVPVVKEHLTKANTIASSLGIAAGNHTK